MPELPEAETIKRDLLDKIVGLRIREVRVYDPRVIHSLPERAFKRGIAGAKISSVARRGKSLIVAFAGKGYLVVQLGMTGQLIYGDDLKNTCALKETKVVFVLSNLRYLNYNDQRLFGRLIFTRDLDGVTYLRNLGPEPLNGLYNTGWLKKSLRAKKAPIKNLLLNQAFVAGIGNIYASEIIFRAGIGPRRRAKTLSPGEIRRLYSSTRAVLREAIRCRGTSMRNYRDSSGREGNFKDRLRVYGREGQKCFTCRCEIKRIVQAGRSTFYCGICQR